MASALVVQPSRNGALPPSSLIGPAAAIHRKNQSPARRRAAPVLAPGGYQLPRIPQKLLSVSNRGGSREYVDLLEGLAMADIIRPEHWIDGQHETLLERALQDLLGKPQKRVFTQLSVIAGSDSLKIPKGWLWLELHPVSMGCVDLSKALREMIAYSPRLAGDFLRNLQPACFGELYDYQHVENFNGDRGLERGETGDTPAGQWEPEENFQEVPKQITDLLALEPLGDGRADLIQGASAKVQKQWQLLERSIEATRPALGREREYSNNMDRRNRKSKRVLAFDIVDEMLMDRNCNVPWVLMRWKKHDSIDALFDYEANAYGELEPWPDFSRLMQIDDVKTVRQYFNDLRLVIESLHALDSLLGAMNAYT